MRARLASIAVLGAVALAAFVATALARPAAAGVAAAADAGPSPAARPAAAAVAAAADAGASPAAAPRVQQMVVFRDGHALTKRVSTAATSVSVSGHRCAVGERTPLAALVRGRPGRLGFRDFGACSSRARDAAGILVTRIGPNRNRGQRGWVYKVGRRAATAGAGDTSGPFGRGRLRAGQRVTWFYCLRAGDCQRTLAVTSKPTTGGIVATVRGYDDNGDGVAVVGATVSAGEVTGITGPDGRVQMALSSGAHRVVARKDGLVRSFTERVEVP